MSRLRFSQNRENAQTFHRIFTVYCHSETGSNLSESPAAAAVFNSSADFDSADLAP